MPIAEQDANVTPLLYRLASAAAALEVSPSTVRRLIAAGKIRTVPAPTGTGVRITAAELARFCAQLSSQE